MSAATDLSAIVGDITQLEVDAIVNAANSSLLGGGGVDGAIHRAAGPELVQACRMIGRCRTGQAVITPGFRLPARYVIHTVGPVWQGGDAGEAQLLASCYRRSIELAERDGCTTLAFSCISTGVYGYPHAPACEIAVRSVRDMLPACSSLSRVIFCCFSESMLALYRQRLGSD